MNAMHYIQSPIDFRNSPRPWIFLAGSVILDTSSGWRNFVVSKIAAGRFNGSILNPQHASRDSALNQPDEDILPSELIRWELMALEQADRIFMYFASANQSPITLLELGLTAHTGRLVVCCERRFWKRDYVLAVCHRYHVPVIEEIEEFQGYVPQ